MIKSSEIVFDNWQEKILAVEGNLLICTGRQVGKTTILAIKAAEYLIQNPKTQIIIISLTEDQAKLIIIMILDYLEVKYGNQICTGNKKPQLTKIELKNGSIALARPVGTTGDAIRGFTGDVLIIDEGARMPELAFTAGKPVLLTTGGQIWMSSTPHGKQGYFYDCFLNKSGRWTVFHINSEEVIKNRKIAGKWTEEEKSRALKFLEDEKKEMSELQYGQEYLALFLDELRQYFPDTLIEKCCVLKRPELSSATGINYLGVDIARLGGDECAFEIISALNENCFHQFENITKKGQLTTTTEDDIISINNRWQPEKIGIDAGSGSLGVGIFDRLMKNPDTKRKVIAMNNREIFLDRKKKHRQKIFKEEMYENMLTIMERGELWLLNDADIKLSLKSVQWELVKREEAAKVRIFGNYTHIAEGLVRACWLAKKEKINKLRISYM